MVATVLIGKSQRGQGVGVSILSLGDEQDPNFGHQTRAHSVRLNVAEQWALLQSYSVPSSKDEMVFKISRHSVVPGQTWTWLGCYRFGRFFGNARGGTYVGVGVLALNEELKALEFVTYITNLLNDLIDRFTSSNGETLSTFELKDLDIEPATRQLNAFLTPIKSFGLTAGSTRRAYVDLSDIGDKGRFDTELSQTVMEAQNSQAFSPFFEVTIGNHQRLANNAKRSQAFEFFPYSTERGRLPDLSEVSPEKVFTKTVSVSIGQAVSIDRSIGVEAPTSSPVISDEWQMLRRDFRDFEERLERRLTDIEKMIVSHEALRSERPWRFDRNVGLADVAAIILALAGIVLLLVNYL